jgi:hypothetical protein
MLRTAWLPWGAVKPRNRPSFVVSVPTATLVGRDLDETHPIRHAMRERSAHDPRSERWSLLQLITTAYVRWHRLGVHLPWILGAWRGSPDPTSELAIAVQQASEAASMRGGPGRIARS